MNKKEQGEEMKNKYHYDYITTHVVGDRKAEVFIRFPDKVYGIEMYEHDTMLKREVYKSKSEQWAQDAAENFVFGIKN